MMQAKKTEVFARLRNIVVTDANSQSLHRKVTFDFCDHPHSTFLAAPRCANCTVTRQGQL